MREIRIYLGTHLFLQILELFGPITIFYDRKAVPNYWKGEGGPIE